MFSRKIKTVASIMESFRQAITDLETIVEQNIIIAEGLDSQRRAIDDKIEVVDLEIHQARGTADRMSDLVFGPDPSTECSGGCPK